MACFPSFETGVYVSKIACVLTVLLSRLSVIVHGLPCSPSACWLCRVASRPPGGARGGARVWVRGRRMSDRAPLPDAPRHHAALAATVARRRALRGKGLSALRTATVGQGRPVGRRLVSPLPRV